MRCRCNFNRVLPITEKNHQKDFSVAGGDACQIFVYGLILREFKLFFKINATDCNQI